MNDIQDYAKTPPQKNSSTAERIKQIMQERGLKQIDIIEACKPYCERFGVKIGKNDLSQYISGKVQPRQDKLSILSLALGVPETWLMGYGESNEHSQNSNLPNLKKTTEPKQKHNILRVPVYGNVAAGIPIDAITDIEDYEELDGDKFNDAEYIALKIKGQSMLPRFSDGDVVIVRLQNDVENGDIAVVMVNGGEATCKKIKKIPEGIYLISTNPAYDPMFFPNVEIESLPVRILGKVVELRAKF